jgi:L-fucose isomerase-like protein
MHYKKDFKIGYAPTRRTVFSREDALKYKSLVLEKIKSWGYKTVDIEGINEDGLLINTSDIEAAVAKFKNEKVDCIFSPHCNFGTEDVVANVAKEMNLPFLLWGPRDEAPLEDGSRLRDSQCGLFATSKILQRLSVPFTYIINSRVDDDIFKRGFDNFAAASNVVKAFKKIRIGQIGTRPAPFWSVMVNEAELLEKFNIQVVPYNLIDVINSAIQIKKKKSSGFLNTISYFKDNFKINIEEDKLENITALKEAVKNLKERDNINAFAIQCWTALGDIFGIVPCSANAFLFDEDIPVACETDINGAISAIIATSATFYESKVMFADITIRHPQDDNKELLWHCGPFPPSLKKDGIKGEISCHGILDNHAQGIFDYEVKGGDISVVRFDGLKGDYKLFCGQALGTDGPKTTGTYLWIKVKDWGAWEEKLIYGPYIHHVAAVNGKISPVLHEASKYIRDLVLDAIEPDENEIRDIIAGRK